MSRYSTILSGQNLPSYQLFVPPCLPFCRVGVIPEKLGQLMLDQLDVSNNKLTGKPLDIAQQWLIVDHLKLSMNNLTGKPV